MRAANGVRAFPIRQDSTVIGRGADCDVPLTNETKLSRQHVRVVRDGSGWAMEDMGSSNGTFFGARRIQRRSISDGDVFNVGPLHLQLRLDDTAPCTIPGAADETQPAGYAPTMVGAPAADHDGRPRDPAAPHVLARAPVDLRPRHRLRLAVGEYDPEVLVKIGHQGQAPQGIP